MKIYAIRDKLNVYGYIFSNNEHNNYYMEINDRTDNHSVFFHIFLEKGERVINKDWTKRYVEERTIPIDRQNIVDILRDAKMKYYNELLLFIKAKGKSSMDNYYLEEVEYGEIVDSVKLRREKMILDFIFDNDKLIIFFKDGVTKVYYIKDEEELKYISNEEPFLSIFGEEIIFNSRVRYTYDYLYNNGKEVDFSYQSLRNYMNKNIYKTGDVTSTLGCSRQYVYILKEDDKLKPMNEDVFIKNDVIRFLGK